LAYFIAWPCRAVWRARRLRSISGRSRRSSPSLDQVERELGQ
jgi:hypothetical protein